MVSKESLEKTRTGNGIKNVGIMTGPTGTGKSGLAVTLAERNPSIEIINADSLLVYRGMDIGAAKPSLEERRGIPHHLIDIRNPNEPFTAGEFFRAATEAIEDIHKRGKRALIVGGTGFYLKSLLHGLWEAPPTHPEWRETLKDEETSSLYSTLFRKDPPSALLIGDKDRYRIIRSLEIIEFGEKSPTVLRQEASREPNPQFKLWILDRPPSELHARVESRTEQMLSAGLIEETKKVLENFPKSRTLDAVGYRQVVDSLKGKKPEGRKLKSGVPGLVEEINLATRQLIKQQRTWFRGQTHKPSSTWFILDEERDKLEEAFQAVYE